MIYRLWIKQGVIIFTDNNRGAQFKALFAMLSSVNMQVSDENLHVSESLCVTSLYGKFSIGFRYFQRIKLRAREYKMRVI